MRKLLAMILCLNVVAFSQSAFAEDEKPVDVLLIGGGIMSATLGTYLQELEPDWSIDMVDLIDHIKRKTGKKIAAEAFKSVRTAEALEPFRKAQPARPEGDPQPLPYLLDKRDQAAGAC